MAFEDGDDGNTVAEYEDASNRFRYATHSRKTRSSVMPANVPRLR